MFPTLFGPTATGDAAEQARSEAILDVSLAVADRGEQVRSQVRGRDRRGADRAAPGPAGRAAAVRRERRILFDGVRAEIHPYDVTVERDGAAEAYDCKWGARGINADVLHQLDDARTHAADEDEPLRVALVVFDAAPVVRGPARPADGAARRHRPGHARDARRAGRRPDDRPRAGRLLRRRIRVRFDEAAPDGLLRTSVLLRYAQDLAWFHSSARGFDRDWYAERGLTWLVRAAEVAVVAPVRVGSELVGTTRVDRGAACLGAAPDRLRRRRRGGGRGRHDRLGPARRARSADAHPGRVRTGRSGRRRRRIELGRVELGAAPADAARATLDRPAAGARSDGPRQQRRLCRLARGGGHRGRRPGRRARDPAPGASRLRPRGGARRDRRGDDVAGSRWPWSCRIADADGADLLRARLEAGPIG